MFATRALRLCLGMQDIHTVLDIGCGRDFTHARAFQAAGKQVTCYDPPMQHAELPAGMEWHLGDLEELEASVDLVWSSHTLEHVLDVQSELESWVSACRIGGLIAITVPPFKRAVVGGHVNGFTAGTLLYRLVLAGVDCSKAMVKTHGYNISVVVRYAPAQIQWHELTYDHGDIERLAHWFPPQCRQQGFDGHIAQLNWSD